MASVDGARSLHVASDEIYDHYCDPCNYDGNQREGANYCENCEEYLCKSCVESHKRFKTSRNHKILLSNEVSTAKIKPHRISISCACEHGSEVGVFCEDHKDVICQTCKTIKHRGCKTSYLQDKSSGYAVSSLDAVVKKILAVQNEIKTFQRDRIEDMQRITTTAENCRKEIRAFRKDLELRWDVLEKNLLSELDKTAQKFCQEIDRHTSTCSDTEKLLEKDVKLLEEMRKCGSKDMIYAADIRVSNHLKDFQLLLQDIQKERRSPVLEFKRNHNLLNFIENTGTLGTLEAKECREEKKEVISLLDMHIDNSRQISVQLPDDMITPSLTGCAFMSDEQLLLCDRNNSNIKLLNSNFDKKGKLGLKSMPCDVAAVDCSTAIVTFPYSQQLQVIQVVPHLAADRVIQIDRRCWGIDVVDGIIYTICHDDPGNAEVYVLNMAGNVIRKIGQSTWSKNQDKAIVFQRPYYLTVSKASKQIYISDAKTNMLTCLQSDGAALYRYRDTDLRGPVGIYVDDKDNVLICGRKSYNIHTVTPDGKKHGLLVTSNDGLQWPLSLAYRHSDRTLVVGCYHGKLAIFKPTK